MISISSALEDYLKAAAILHKRTLNVRITDVADFLNVSKSSVSRAIGALRDACLVEHDYYSNIVLTPQGQEYAGDLLRRHDIIKFFFVHVVGVDEETAEMDASRLEHSLSPTTMEKMNHYFDTLPHDPLIRNRVVAFHDDYFGQLGGE